MAPYLNPVIQWVLIRLLILMNLVFPQPFFTPTHVNTPSTISAAINCDFYGTNASAIYIFGAFKMPTRPLMVSLPLLRQTNYNNVQSVHAPNSVVLTATPRILVTRLNATKESLWTPASLSNNLRAMTSISTPLVSMARISIVS
jgi:hypothetical protein